MPRLPDRWLDYDNVGDIIQGTRLITFKVPLKESFFVHAKHLPEDQTKNLPEDQWFTPTQLLENMNDRGLKLGLIIDLTFTTKYYNPEVFTSQGVQYQKIFVEGHVIPKKEVMEKFHETVDEFLEKSEEDSLVGVHCTHGVNRTGYVVCRYMVERLGKSATEALEAYENARGYPVERPNYIFDLRKRAGEVGEDEEMPVPEQEHGRHGNHGGSHRHWRGGNSGHHEGRNYQRGGHSNYHDVRGGYSGRNYDRADQFYHRDRNDENGGQFSHQHRRGDHKSNWRGRGYRQNGRWDEHTGNRQYDQGAEQRGYYDNQGAYGWSGNQYGGGYSGYGYEYSPSDWRQQQNYNSYHQHGYHAEGRFSAEANGYGQYMDEGAYGGRRNENDSHIQWQNGSDNRRNHSHSGNHHNQTSDNSRRGGGKMRHEKNRPSSNGSG